MILLVKARMVIVMIEMMLMYIFSGKAHDTAVRAMVWSHNENWMVTADHGGEIKYWQPNMNNVKQFTAHEVFFPTFYFFFFPYSIPFFFWKEVGKCGVNFIHKILSRT
eukprot:TRINITY_DN2726_c0_g1_i13.p1 TRINITY_DN2726_c0_g1~~TRINITY_DN2726_c0_g1_i13.p1  ORF type:complete len:108 (-),score=10.09 TRINITY_DN2726_c0_g1_i13:148-471(-)